MQTAFLSFIDPWLALLADDPSILFLQLTLLALGIVDVFLIFFATRDSILRTTNFVVIVISILLVAALPGIGFFIYLLVRPARTIKEREMEDMLLRLLKDL